MRGVLAEMRLLLIELQSGTLNDLALTDLLRQLAAAAVGNSGAKATICSEGPSQARLPADVHLGPYRIAQEALSNVVKHARAGQVNLLLCYRADGGVFLEINDDGLGFDPAVSAPGHLGASIMCERAGYRSSY